MLGFSTPARWADDGKRLKRRLRVAAAKLKVGDSGGERSGLDLEGWIQGLRRSLGESSFVS